MKRIFSLGTSAVLCALALVVFSTPVLAEDLAAQFANPPDSAKPWVYWFWNNGNVTKAGITADLEAMRRVGIGGVIIMDVVERFAPPAGPAEFMSAHWRELFRFAVAEARRLGLKINMTNGPGWCGSSGPWITPELSMQKLVTASLAAEGPVHFAALLPRPALEKHRGETVFDSTVSYSEFYRDIAVLAYPATPNGEVAPERVVDLTTRLDPQGRLNWDVPAGHWVIQRIGHTTTGVSTRPPVKGGNGLECDKLSREAMDVHFANMMGKLISEVGASASSTLVATHIDSWEVRSQNWTPRFREEFHKRRGYDLLPFLPDIIAAPIPGSQVRCTIGPESVARRFRWDFQQTVSELLAENYVGRLARLAHQHGLRLTIEGYHLPFGDEATYTGRADEPMSEFWATGGNENQAKARQMASVAHIMGEKIVGAEAFTASDNEQWKFHPATVKALGDYEFSQGINRFVIHRYAFQPYLDRYPGATMGPWGLHYERTQTWWEMSDAWHQYLARCQQMLRQGKFVADLCYLRPELPNQTHFTPEPPVPAGYKYDECSAEALMARMSVKGGRLVLPDGMSYRLLVLPASARLMTPALVKKIKQLVAAGATVLGPRPSTSPSLSDFPKCDAEVARLAAEIWGDCDGEAVKQHSYGKGRVMWNQPLKAVLEQMQAPADFTSGVKLNWLHRQVGDTHVYFVANEAACGVDGQCQFRVQGMRPELWNPETGGMSPLAIYAETNGMICLPLRLEPSGSTFVVFRPQKKRFDPVVGFTRNGQSLLKQVQRPEIQIQAATYGVPGDAARTREVTAKVRALVDAQELEFQVARLAEGDDPAYGTVKTLTVNYTLDGRQRQLSGRDPDVLKLVPLEPAAECAAEVQCDAKNALRIAAHQPGRYELKMASGKMLRTEVFSVPAPKELTGPWRVTFPPNWGAPDSITLTRLGSLSDSLDEGVRHFSGTATYTKSFDWSPDRPAGNAPCKIVLDLGEVAVMARVSLNGRSLGSFWKAPFRVDVSQLLQPGSNTLEVSVANLWPNRMIGDAALPAARRFTWSSYEPFTKDSPLPQSGLLGPVTLQTIPIAGAAAALK